MHCKMHFRCERTSSTTSEANRNVLGDNHGDDGCGCREEDEEDDGDEGNHYHHDEVITMMTRCAAFGNEAYTVSRASTRQARQA